MNIIAFFINTFPYHHTLFMIPKFVYKVNG